jgi:hypothetical protein
MNAQRRQKAFALEEKNLLMNELHAWFADTVQYAEDYDVIFSFVKKEPSLTPGENHEMGENCKGLFYSCIQVQKDLSLLEINTSQRVSVPRRFKTWFAWQIYCYPYISDYRFMVVDENEEEYGTYPEWDLRQQKEGEWYNEPISWPGESSSD